MHLETYKMLFMFQNALQQTKNFAFRQKNFENPENFLFEKQKILHSDKNILKTQKIFCCGKFIWWVEIEENLYK